MPLFDFAFSYRVERLLQHQLRVQQQILGVVEDIRARLMPRLTRLTITLSGGTMPLQVGATTTATVNGFDQFGNPFAIDFAANPPSWSVSDPALATLTPNAADPNKEDVTGVAAGTETLSVSVAGLSANLSFAVEAPAPVLTSVTITTEPPVV